MITNAWTLILVSGLVASAIAWLAALMSESGIRPLRGLAALIKAQPKAGRILIGAAFASAWIVAGAKPGGTRSGDGARHVDVKSRGECSGDGAPAVAEGTAATGSRDGGGADATADAGLALVRMGTGEAFDLSPPSNATVCADWLAFGAAEDWTYLSFSNWSVRVGDASSSRLRVHSCGWAEALPDRGAAAGATDRAHSAYMPLRAPLCIVPRANWPLIATTLKPETQSPEPSASSLKPETQNLKPITSNLKPMTSLFWHCLTPSNTLLLTWRNALYAHRADAPVSVQAEIRQGGGADFRYSLPRPAEAADGQSSSVAIGVSAGGSGWLTNALPPGATSVRLESGLERRCAACLETFASRLGGLDPMSCPPGSTNTVWEHIAYAGTPDGAFTIPQSSDAAAVLEVSVSGSGTGVLDVGGAAFPLVGPGGAVASVQSAAAVQLAVAIPAASPLRSPPPSPPSLRVQVPRGQTVPLYVTGDGTLSVSLSSGDFAFGVLPDLAGGTLVGWVNFPNASPTPACIHDYRSRLASVTLPVGRDAGALRCAWMGCDGVTVTNRAPRSAAIVGNFPPGGTRTVRYTLSHPLHLFGDASGEQEVRFCPVPPEPGPDGELEDAFAIEFLSSGCDCAEGCGGDCRCSAWGCSCAWRWHDGGEPPPAPPTPEGYAEAKANVAHMSGVLPVRVPPLFGTPIRLDIPDSDPNCCPCPEHARRSVSLVCASRGLAVVDADGADFSAATETVDVRVAATEPSRTPGDMVAAFATNGTISLMCAYTALGVGIGKDGADLAALNALSPDFGLPVPVTTNMDAAASLALRTDVLLRGMNVHVAFEGASAPFALWIRDAVEGGWRNIASSDGGPLDLSLSAWRGLVGADPTDASLRTEARVTAEGAGTATLVFRAWGVAGGLFVEDEARQAVTAVDSPLRMDVNRDGRIDAADAAASAAGRPFAFWCNEDRVKGDFVGQVADAAPNVSDLKVNGRLDLVNLFPVALDLSAFMAAWGGAAEFTVRPAYPVPDDAAPAQFNVCLASLRREAAWAFQTSPCATLDGEPVAEATLAPMPAFGVRLTRGTLGRVSAGSCAMLCEATRPGVSLAIDVGVGGTVVYTHRPPMDIRSVRDMYRLYSLRGAESADGAFALPPRPLVDSLPGEKDLDVFLAHGFNVTEDDARAWGDAIFKRLWIAGSRARFGMVAWNGNHHWTGDWANGLHYQQDVYHALKTGDALRRLVEREQPDPSRRVLMAHSLGNMVACEALRQGLRAGKYLMFNAAVAGEAVDGTLQRTDPSDTACRRYVPSSWRSYPCLSWAANWFRWFAGFQGDRRAEMGWVGRYALALDHADEVYNYYSKGDEVFFEAENPPWVLEGMLDSSANYCWQKQETLKGMQCIAGTAYGGWGFHFRGSSPSDVYTAEEATSMVADGSVTNSPVFNRGYGPMLAPDATGDEVMYALAKYVPAVSSPVGGNPVLQEEGRHFDMNSDRYRNNGWGRPVERGLQPWKHSDIKDIAYYYISKLFEELASPQKGDLK